MSNTHFICGHRYNHQGASGINPNNLKKITEWQYAMELQQYLTNPFVFEDAYTLENNKSMINADTIAIEFHLNSFNSHVEGYEILVLKDDMRSYVQAEKIIRLIKKNFPERRNRGIKIISENDRGYNNLLRLKKHYNTALITEFFFLSTPSDWMDFEEAAIILNQYDDERFISGDCHRTLLDEGKLY